jgi:hypothetical protein
MTYVKSFFGFDEDWPWGPSQMQVMPKKKKLFSLFGPPQKEIQIIFISIAWNKKCWVTSPWPPPPRPSCFFFFGITWILRWSLTGLNEKQRKSKGFVAEFIVIYVPVYCTLELDVNCISQEIFQGNHVYHEHSRVTVTLPVWWHSFHPWT